MLSSGYHHGIADGAMALSSTRMGGVVSIHFAGFQIIRRFLKKFVNDREKKEVQFNQFLYVYSRNHTLRLNAPYLLTGEEVHVCAPRIKIASSS